MAEIICDKRGKLVEIFNLKDSRVYYVTANPGVSRGNHYHKESKELFCVIEGEGIIEVGDKRFEVSGENPTVIEIPVLQRHSVINIGNKELKMLAWADKPYDPKDTY